MEIHAPDHPILTFKQALVHLCLITMGILIALSLEGTVEWWHHRELVRETRQNLENELRSNQKSIQTVLKGLEPTKKRFIHAVDLLNGLSATAAPAKSAAAAVPVKPDEIASIFNPTNGGLLEGMSFAWLNTASYKTAETSGALGLMEYSEAFKYSDIYDLQELYIRMQDAAERDMFAAYTLGTSIVAKPTPIEIADVKRQLLLALGTAGPMTSMATKLDELYARALKDTP